MEPIIKLLGTAVSLGAGFASAKIVDVLWEKTTGNEAPKKGEEVDQSFAQAVAFAVVSAAVSALITTATRKATAKAVKSYNKSQYEVA